MFLPPRRLASLIAFGSVLLLPRVGSAQVTSSFKACTGGALDDCAWIRLTSTSSGGSNLFEIAINNLGSLATPATPTSILFLTFATGAPSASGGGSSTDAAPVGSGGAHIFDATHWGVVDTGDLLAIFAPGNDGIGSKGSLSCGTQPVANPIGQMSQSCDGDDFVSFSFSTPEAFDPSLFTIADFEVSSVPTGDVADSCGAGSCLITERTTTPEPSSMVLFFTGFAGLAGIASRRRATRTARGSTMQEG